MPLEDAPIEESLHAPFARKTEIGRMNALMSDQSIFALERLRTQIALEITLIRMREHMHFQFLAIQPRAVAHRAFQQVSSGMLAHVLPHAIQRCIRSMADSARVHAQRPIARLLTVCRPAMTTQKRLGVATFAACFACKRKYLIMRSTMPYQRAYLLVRFRALAALEIALGRMLGFMADQRLPRRKSMATHVALVAFIRMLLPNMRSLRLFVCEHLRANVTPMEFYRTATHVIQQI